MTENPRIISICSVCKSRSNVCKLIQYKNSGNYRLICNLCYTNPDPTDIIINISNYNDNQINHTPNNNDIENFECQKIKETFYSICSKSRQFLQYIAKNCIKGMKTIGKKLKIKERFNCCKQTDIDDDRQKLEENV